MLCLGASEYAAVLCSVSPHAKPPCCQCGVQTRGNTHCSGVPVKNRFFLDLNPMHDIILLINRFFKLKCAKKRLIEVFVVLTGKSGETAEQADARRTRVSVHFV